MSSTSSRRVAFLEAVEVQEVLSLYNYTHSEISSTWYNEEEMDKISRRCYNILRRHEREAIRSKSKYCMRGLESMTSTGYSSKKSNRSAAFVAVLEEQERQRSENEDQEIKVQAISDAYRQTSASCQMWAQVVGNRDQQAVEAYLYDNDEAEVETTSAPSVVTSSKPQTSQNLGRCLASICPCTSSVLPAIQKCNK